MECLSFHPSGKRERTSEDTDKNISGMWARPDVMVQQDKTSIMLRKTDAHGQGYGVFSLGALKIPNSYLFFDQKSVHKRVSLLRLRYKTKTKCVMLLNAVN